MIWSQCSRLRAATAMSLTIWFRSDFTVSIAPIEPPAPVIAEVTSLSIPASLSERILKVRLNDALGVTGMNPCLEKLAAFHADSANHTFECSTAVLVFIPWPWRSPTEYQRAASPPSPARESI
jgi:hypothetical protein